MNFQEQLHDKLQLIKSILHNKLTSIVQATTAKTKVALEGPKTIEIAGYTILAMPLETMTLTPEQRKTFTKSREEGGAGGFEVQCYGPIVDKIVDEIGSARFKDKLRQFDGDHSEAPIDWQLSFETRQETIDGILYRGFDLFQKVYEAFPDIAGMTKEEATEAGLYPIIHYRNFAARQWMAEMLGGHLATLDKDYNGELADIYDAAEGQTVPQKLAAMGQSLLGTFWPSECDVFGFGTGAYLASGSLDDDDQARGLLKCTGGRISCNYRFYKFRTASSVVVMNKQ